MFNLMPTQHWLATKIVVAALLWASKTTERCGE
jgi:hypothetical protein